MLIAIAIAVVLAGFAYSHYKLHVNFSSLIAKFGGKSPTSAPVGSPAVPVPPITSATPPTNSGSTGTLVGQAVPGGDVPDANGAIAIPAIASKFAPGSRFLTVVSLPYVPPASAPAFCIAANCANANAAEAITGLASVVALAVVKNPPSATAVGFQAFHLANGVSGEPRQVLPNVVSLSPSLTTVAAIVAKYQNEPDYGTQGSGSGFSPGH